MEVLIWIFDIEFSIEDVQFVYKWLCFDEYFICGMDIEFFGKVKLIYELFDVEFLDFDVFGYGFQVCFVMCFGICVDFG